MNRRPWLTAFGAALGVSMTGCGDTQSPAVTAVGAREVTRWDAAAAPDPTPLKLTILIALKALPQR